MVFERRHAAKETVVHKMWKPPLHGLFNIGATAMSKPTQTEENWLREVC